jgi:hypothetical protein
VASGVPRLDYYTSGGTAGCPALLVEPSAQNFVLNSQNTATDWTIGANTASGYVDVIGVSGNTITASASGAIGGSVFVRRALNTALASGSTYTVSFLMRQTGAHTIGGYWIGIAGVGDIGGGFDVSGSFSSGAIYSAAGATNRIRRVERWGADVYRCSETFTLTASGTLDRILMGPVSAVNSTASVASGTQMAFAAPQIELGAIPTSFIPTTAAAVTRNADLISLSSVSGVIGQTEGTIYWEGSLGQIDKIFFSIGASTTQTIRFETRSDGLLQFSVVSGSNQCAITTSGAITVGQFYKIAGAYKQDNFVFYVNGVQVGDDNSGTIPTALAQMQFSSSATANLSIQRCRALALYTTRLTNSELAALTT